jgi:hypothetical protein
MVSWYPELTQSINFIDFSEITEDTLSRQVTRDEFYLEDYFSMIDLNQYFKY